MQDTEWIADVHFTWLCLAEWIQSAHPIVCIVGRYKHYPHFNMACMHVEVIIDGMENIMSQWSADLLMCIVILINTQCQYYLASAIHEK